jgi:hypothetical protein
LDATAFGELREEVCRTREEDRENAMFDLNRAADATAMLWRKQNRPTDRTDYCEVGVPRSSWGWLLGPKWVHQPLNGWYICAGPDSSGRMADVVLLMTGLLVTGFPLPNGHLQNTQSLLDNPHLLLRDIRRIMAILQSM